MNDALRSFGLMLVLLNPFLVIVYLVDVVSKLERKQFVRVLIRAGIVSAIVFCGFAFLGDAVFATVVQAHFASFQIFGGVVFLIIGLQFVFKGPTAIEMLRGESKHLAGSIAMPVLIGPGTISASIIIGERHSLLIASSAIVAAVIVSIVVMLAMKSIHDYVLPRNEDLVDRYIAIAGRITALFVGTISIEMIMQGLLGWSSSFSP